MSTTQEISRQPQPQSQRGRQLGAGIVLLGVTAIWSGVLTMRGMEQGLHAKDYWMLGVVAVSIVASLHQLRPSRGSAWLVAGALGLLTILLFVSGASQGGSFLMWTAGSATFFSPVLLWAFEPDAEESAELNALYAKIFQEEAEAERDELAAAA